MCPDDESRPTTRELYESASRGHGPAIDRLLERFLPDLAAYVRRHAGRLAVARESCSDLVQSICRDLFEHLGDGRFECRGEGPFRQWLYRAALLRIHARRRYHGAERRDPARERPTDALEATNDATAGPAFTPSAIVAGQEELERLQRAIEGLPERYAAILELVQVDGLSHARAAERLGLSESHSRVLLARARARLASLLHQDESRQDG